jgi:hypothetical protein
MTSKNNHKASSGGDNSNSHTPSWTNPSAAHMIQYGLQPLPDDFIPTPQEQVLIDMYGTMNQYERQAKRLREDAARRKLETSKAVFEQKQAASKNKNKRKRRSNATAEGGVTLGPSDDDNDDDTDMEDAEWDEENEEETAQSLHEKREAHLEVLRQEVEEKQNKEREEDLRRAAHLQEEEADEGLPAVVLQRKTKNANATQASSLIATLKAAATPLHEFSSAYELDNGEILYPKEGMGPEDFWSPPLEGPVSSPNEGALEVILDKFDLQLADNGTGPNTIGIKFKAPSDSKRFSINISVANEHNNFDSVLFHFNPRQHQKGGQLVINDKKEGQWGQAINIPLSQLPMIFGQTTSTLVIQINSEGFDVFIEKEHCARLEHRTSLPSGQTRLVMQFPSSDDSGSPERWNILKVFWGGTSMTSETKSSLSISSLPLSLTHTLLLFSAPTRIRSACLPGQGRFGGGRWCQYLPSRAPAQTDYSQSPQDSIRFGYGSTPRRARACLPQIRKRSGRHCGGALEPLLCLCGDGVGARDGTTRIYSSIEAWRAHQPPTSLTHFSLSLGSGLEGDGFCLSTWTGPPVETRSASRRAGGQGKRGRLGWKDGSGQGLGLERGVSVPLLVRTNTRSRDNEAVVFRA